MAFNLKTNSDAELVGIQLIYEQSGTSPIFEAVDNRRMLNESDIILSSCVEECTN